jgi:hypothetical protein
MFLPGANNTRLHLLRRGAGKMKDIVRGLTDRF